MKNAKIKKVIVQVTAQLIEKHGLSLTLSAFTVLIAVLNLYVASKLAPVVQSIELLDNRVHAIEIDRTNDKSLLERFYKVETITQTMNEQMKVFNQKLDRILEGR